MPLASLSFHTCRSATDHCTSVAVSEYVHKYRRICRVHILATSHCTNVAVSEKVFRLPHTHTHTQLLSLKMKKGSTLSLFLVSQVE